jgi:adenylate kinase family enzyme
MSGITSKIVEEGGKSIFNIVSSLIKSAGRIALDEIHIRKATELYAENYLKRYCFVKILGMSEPFPLIDLYTEVQVISTSYRIKERIIQDLENEFRQTRGTFTSKSNRISGLQIANEQSKLNVLGPPGSGKSTFLRRIGLECLLLDNNVPKEVYRHKCIPVLIEFKRFKNEPIDLMRLIQKEFEIASFPESDRFLKRALKEGKLLILFDGLDEVPENKLTELLEHTKDFADKYRNNRFISSCRSAYYKNFLKDFTDVEISSFNDNQIQQFVNNWFFLEKDALSDTGSIFLQLLYEKANAATVELARTPLLLAFLCMTFDHTQRFPSSRSSLYKQALLILMQKWAAEKRIHNDDIYRELNFELETEMLSDTAAYFYKQDKIFFYDYELKSRLKEFLDRRIANNSLDIQKVVEAIEVQQGILVERSPSIYSFSHLTIQEYLTAHFYNSPIRITELIRGFLFEDRWREVFLLLIGIGDPNDTLMLISAYLGEYAGSNTVISEAVKWIREILIPDTEFEHGTQKRIFFVSLILRYKRYDSKWNTSYTRLEAYADNLLKGLPLYRKNELISIPKLTDTINRKQAILILDRTRTWVQPTNKIDSYKERIILMRPPRPIASLPVGSRHNYRIKIAGELYAALKAPREICSQRKSYYTPLINYLKGAALIIDCAKSTSLTSKAVWEKICKNIL